MNNSPVNSAKAILYEQSSKVKDLGQHHRSLQSPTGYRSSRPIPRLLRGSPVRPSASPVTTHPQFSLMPRPLTPTLTRTLSEKASSYRNSPCLRHIISHPSVASTLHLIFPSKPEKLRHPRRALRPLSLSSANRNSNHPHSPTYRRPATPRLPTKLYLVDFWGGVLSRPIPFSLPPTAFFRLAGL
ncbi:hypothetical protein CPAR01_09317 [Colletotrichum paranaense]|uniref:Uncharacterized protein n=1 Tax=Colletotrichum paranaense TaxID=1914294 RepID=A0ABQ9SGD2_9PEZI|nr:uncharacterized protein CPAR01_09317 [Colletotrichum paranaense]KAK1535775.1 hypothetical protein CPAR01_09317 [Colletotrichum paranaense]